jgi:hypothetical protein
MTAIQNDPVYSLPLIYKNGLILSNDATTPNTIIDISAGQCRDSNDTIDIVSNAVILLNAAVNGVNGLDTGTFAASTMYAIYMIADSRNFQVPAAMLTLASNSSPLMPFDYDSFRLIGYWASNGATHFYPGYYSGVGADLLFTYDAPIATAVTAGASTTYAPVVLTTLVPPINNLPVTINSIFSAAAAGDILNMQGFNSVGDAITIIAPVATGVANTENYDLVLAQLNVKAPTINYKVSAGTVAIDVAGFNLYL